MSELQQTDEIQETRLGDVDVETSDIEAADIEAAGILHQRLEGLDEESASEDDAIAIQQYLTEHNANKENPAYVVRGADLMCNCGTNSRKFNLNQCHGVYIKDHAIVHDHDCIQGEKENITWFGVCTSGEAPDTENIKLIGGDNQEHTGKKCTPVIVDIWQNSYDKTQVVKNESCKDGNLENAVVHNTVTMDSFLVCKYGGIIMPINSGQDRTVEDSEFVEGEEAHKRVLEGTEECEEEISREEGCEDLLHMMIADEFKDREVSRHGSAFYVTPEEGALIIIRDWQKDRSLPAHNVYESIKILEETMTEEEIMSYISVKERLWVDMIEHGYSEMAAAGILGNICVESAGYNVGKLQGSLTEPKSGLGMGLCQWSFAARQQGLYDMASSMGLSWDTYEVQIAFIFSEIDNDNSFKDVRPEALNAIQSLEEITRIFMEVYERPSVEHFDWRKEEAENVYAEYAGGE
ncbi:MAG: DUF4280 domain-containing protein [Lachnospiraceae bacterium]|nr:DUF4280 domain-containing protein [Lachnospiraceae bacterium]